MSTGSEGRAQRDGQLGWRLAFAPSPHPCCSAIRPVISFDASAGAPQVSATASLQPISQWLQSKLAKGPLHKHSRRHFPHRTPVGHDLHVAKDAWEIGVGCELCVRLWEQVSGRTTFRSSSTATAMLYSQPPRKIAVSPSAQMGESCKLYRRYTPADTTAVIPSTFTPDFFCPSYFQSCPTKTPCLALSRGKNLGRRSAPASTRPPCLIRTVFIELDDCGMIAAETFPFARDRRRSVQNFLLLVTFTEEGAST